MAASSLCRPQGRTPLLWNSSTLRRHAAGRRSGRRFCSSRPGRSGPHGRALGAGRPRRSQEFGHRDRSAAPPPLAPALHAHRIVPTGPGCRVGDVAPVVRIHVAGAHRPAAVDAGLRKGDRLPEVDMYRDLRAMARHEGAIRRRPVRTPPCPPTVMDDTGRQRSWTRLPTVRSTLFQSQVPGREVRDGRRHGRGCAWRFRWRRPGPCWVRSPGEPAARLLDCACGQRGFWAGRVHAVPVQRFPGCFVRLAIEVRMRGIGVPTSNKSRNHERVPAAGRTCAIVPTYKLAGTSSDFDTKPQEGGDAHTRRGAARGPVHPGERDRAAFGRPRRPASAHRRHPRTELLTMTPPKNRSPGHRTGRTARPRSAVADGCPHNPRRQPRRRGAVLHARRPRRAGDAAHTDHEHVITATMPARARPLAHPVGAPR